MRKVILAGATGGLMLVAIVSILWLPTYRFNRWSSGVVERLETLRTVRPDGISDSKWQEMVTMTVNAMGNCLYSTSQIRDENAFEAFVRDFELRFSDVEADDKDWFWDQLPKISKNGLTYSRGFRPTKPLGEWWINEPESKDMTSGQN